MKKILFVLNTLRLGGAEKSLVSLLNALDYSKYDVDLLLFEDDGVLRSELPEEVNVIYGSDVTRAMILEFRYYGKSLLKSGHLPAYLSRLTVSLRAKRGNQGFSWNTIKKHIKPLIGHYDTAVSYLEGYPAYFLIDKVNADRKIAWIHTDISKKTVYPEEIEYYSKMDKVVTISEQCKAAIDERIPAVKEKTIVIENLSDPRRIRELAEKAGDFSTWDNKYVHIVTVGRLTEAKGIDQAIEAYTLLSEDIKNLCWHVYGEGELKDTYQKMIEERHIDKGFILEGPVQNPYQFMKRADIIVQPSKWEGKSVVLDEAKILGKAIVVTNYPSAKDQIIDHVNGLIANMNPESVADAVRCLLKDPVLKETLERNCTEEEPPYTRIAAKINKLLNE